MESLLVLARLRGIEPPTSTVTKWHSNHLSYSLTNQAVYPIFLYLSLEECVEFSLPLPLVLAFTL